MTPYPQIEEIVREGRRRLDELAKTERRLDSLTQALSDEAWHAMVDEAAPDRLSEQRDRQTAREHLHAAERALASLEALVRR